MIWAGWESEELGSVIHIPKEEINSGITEFWQISGKLKYCPVKLEMKVGGVA
jgi:hypothetical protein